MMRIGSVPYTNGRPLIYGLGDDTDVDLSMCVPSELARMLRSGEIAAGLVSSAACFHNPELEIVPGIGVCSTGPVESVKIFLRGTVGSIRRVALDTSSLTSVLLARIILAERYGLNPEFVDMPPQIDQMLDVCDAAVLIGDPAMCVPEGRWGDLDLGDEWYKLTGLPFVFAVWAVNPATADPSLIDILTRARARGIGALTELSISEAARLHLPVGRCAHYLSEIMQYEMTADHWAGLRLFQSKAHAHGFISASSRELRLYGGGASND